MVVIHFFDLVSSLRNAQQTLTNEKKKQTNKYSTRYTILHTEKENRAERKRAATGAFATLYHKKSNVRFEYITQKHTTITRIVFKGSCDQCKRNHFEINTKKRKKQ